MSRSIVALFAALAAASALAGQEVREKPQVTAPSRSAPETTAAEGVPVLRDEPILGRLFPKGRTDAFRVVLDADGDGEAGSGTELPYRHRWLMRWLRELHPDLEDVTVLDRTTTRHAEDGTTTEHQRALDVVGSRDVLARARESVQRALAPKAEAVLVELHLLESGSLGGAATQVTLMGHDEIEERIGRARSAAGSVIINSPRLMLLDGQHGTMSIVQEIGYVKDYEVEIIRDQHVADPVIDVVHDGIVVEMAPVIHPDGQHVSLEAKVSIASVLRPIKEVTTRLEGPGTEVTLQLPSVEVSEWKAELVLEPGVQGFAVTGLSRVESGDGGFRQVGVDVLGRVSLVEAPAAGTGRVLGYDREAGRVFADWSGADGRRPAAGRRTFELVRAGEAVGELQLETWHGPVAVLLLRSGEIPLVGDTVR